MQKKYTKQKVQQATKELDNKLKNLFHLSVLLGPIVIMYVLISFWISIALVCFLRLINNLK